MRRECWTVQILINFRMQRRRKCDKGNMLMVAGVIIKVMRGLGIGKSSNARSGRG